MIISINKSVERFHSEIANISFLNELRATNVNQEQQT